MQVVSHPRGMGMAYWGPRPAPLARAPWRPAPFRPVAPPYTLGRGNGLGQAATVSLLDHPIVALVMDAGAIATGITLATLTKSQPGPWNTIGWVVAAVFGLKSLHDVGNAFPSR